MAPQLSARLAAIVDALHLQPGIRVLERQVSVSAWQFACLVTLVASLGCASSAERASDVALPGQAERDERQYSVIRLPDGIPVPFSDAHVHLNDAAGWIRTMDEIGITRSIALAGRDADNSALREAGRRWPERILPFLSVSPEHREFRAAWEADDDRLVPLVDSLLSSGDYYGIGEISVSHFPAAGFPEADFDPNGHVMRSLLQLARKHRVPVLIHSEITRLREFEGLLRDHRDVTVIWAHGGYTPLFLARRLLERHPNLIYELSARTWTRHPRSPEYTIFRDESSVWPAWLDLIEGMPTRFLIGTDASGRSETGDIAKALTVRLFLGQLSTQTRRQVAQKNLDRILGLPSGNR